MIKKAIEIFKKMPWNVKIAAAFVALIIGFVIGIALTIFFPFSIFTIVIIWALWTLIEYLERNEW